MNTDYLLTPCLVAISTQSCQLQRRNSMGNTLQLSCAEDFVTYLNEQLVPGEGIPIKISENNLRLRLFVQELEKEQKYNKELEAENEALHGELHMLSDQIENLEKIVSQKDQQSQQLFETIEVLSQECDSMRQQRCEENDALESSCLHDLMMLQMNNKLKMPHLIASA